MVTDPHRYIGLAQSDLFSQCCRSPLPYPLLPGRRSPLCRLPPAATHCDERPLHSLAVTGTGVRVVINYGKPTVERSHGSVKGQWTRL